MASPDPRQAEVLSARDLRTVLVTGGAGFIGSHLVDFLLRRYARAQVTVLDKLTYAGNLFNLETARATGRLTFIEGDVCDQADALRACEGAQVVIHAAAETHVDRSILCGQAAARTNFLGTFTMLEAARQTGVRRFLHISTDEVYGARLRGKYTERSPLNPRNPYAAAKAGADRMAYAFFATYGLNVVIARPCNNYGPRQFPEKLVPLFIYKALHNEPLPVYGDGRQRRDWMHVHDCCRALDLLLFRGVPGEAYNIPAGAERRNLDTIHILLDELGKPRDLIRFVADRPGHDLRYPMDGHKIRQLGWEPRVPPEQGLRETVRWYVEHQDWLEEAMRRGAEFHRQWYANR